mmetsp:Transcript_4221/g.11905  ORF Transcript_4221/g.11905 Transcript_4221/m.11905 type:complete len:249 (+) Transcript_4221:487-1233(+)
MLKYSLPSTGARSWRSLPNSATALGMTSLRRRLRILSDSSVPSVSIMEKSRWMRRGVGLRSASARFGSSSSSPLFILILGGKSSGYSKSNSYPSIPTSNSSSSRAALEALPSVSGPSCFPVVQSITSTAIPADSVATATRKDTKANFLVLDTLFDSKRPTPGSNPAWDPRKTTESVGLADLHMSCNSLVAPMAVLPRGFGSDISVAVRSRVAASQQSGVTGRLGDKWRVYVLDSVGNISRDRGRPASA